MLRFVLASLVASFIALLCGPAFAQSVRQPIPTGDTPRAIAVNPVTNRIYVANEFSNSVSVIDGRTRAVVATVPVGNRPEYIAVNPYRNRVYVSQGDASISVIDGATNSVASYPIGATGPIAIDPNTNLVYNVRLSTAATDEVTIFDDRSATVQWHSVSTQSFMPMNITFDPLHELYYVVHYTAGHVRAIDATSNDDTPPSTQIDVGKPADLIAGNPITNKWYVLTENASTPIAIVDGATFTPSGFAPAGATGPVALAVNTVTNKTYAVFSTGVFVVSGVSPDTVFIPSGSSAGGPAAIGINKTTNRIYVANTDGTLTVIDGDTNAASTVAIPSGATYVGVNPVTNIVYVTTPSGLTEIDGAATDTVHPNPLQTTIAPFASDSSLSDATFTFNASTAFAPLQLPIQRVYYQVDAIDGPWQVAAGSGNGPYTGTANGLAAGAHTVYAFAVDGQDMPLTGGLSEPLVGSMASYTFHVGGGTPSTTSLGTSKNPASVGDSITFTASVTGSAGPVTGTVDFVDGTAPLGTCSAVALASGTAACTLSTLARGTHSITARYSGSATYDPSTSSAISQVMNPVPVDPTLALSSSLNPSTTGQAVTFTLSVSGTNGTATGTVNFLDGATAIAGCSSVALGASGSATCTTSALSIGSHTITAQYGGDPAYRSGTSPAVTQSVQPKSPSNTTLTSSLNPSMSGQSVALTANVTGGSGSATGTVDFLDGSTPIASCTGVALASGSAACTLTTLAVGSHSLTARYSGNATYDASTSAALMQTVNPQPADVTMSLTSAPNPSTDGQSVAFSVTLTGSQGAVTGAVTFNDGSNAIAGCSNVAVSAGAASCSTSSLAVGSHTVTASYSGSSSYNAGTSAPVSQVVNAAPPPPNVALASAGATAMASSTFSAGFPASAAIDGDATGRNWSAGGGWADATVGQFPDFLQVQFAGPKKVERVVVYTLQDDWQNPVAPTDTMTFSQYGIVDFNVEGWDGTSWQTLATITGNNLVKRTVTFTAFNTDRIRIRVLNALSSLSRIVEVEAYGVDGTPLPPPTSTNVALASNGAAATASSTFGSGFPAASVINGDRKGVSWTDGGGWADGTPDVYPDWVEVDFNGTATIDHVVVYTLQDDWQNPVEPTDTMTFTQYGVLDYAVQAWDGAQWVTLGSVANNSLVKSTVWFDAISTTRLRVNVTRASASVARITEIEAWGSLSAPPPPTQVNVALAGRGAIASASSTLSPDYPVSAINNNERAGAGWSAGGGWADGTFNEFPDWVQVDFNGPQTIDHVVVYTLQDNWQDPVEPTDTLTFTQYGVTDFTVQAWDGTQWLTVGTVSGNNLVKRTVSFTPVTATKVRINVINALSSLARITEVEAWGVPATTARMQTNWALASNGAHAAGSSQYSDAFPANAAINGDRAGTSWSAGGGWADATADTYPDALEVDFASARSIDHVVVYTLQDNWQSPGEPTDTMTFTQYGIQDFDVQGWNGAQWVTLGSVTGNNFAKRTVPFAAFTTDRIRIVVNKSLASLSRITEVEAWGN